MAARKNCYRCVGRVYTLSLNEPYPDEKVYHSRESHVAIAYNFLNILETFTYALSVRLTNFPTTCPLTYLNYVNGSCQHSADGLERLPETNTNVSSYRSSDKVHSVLSNVDNKG